uniref:Histidine decarboxylase n=1 Tax=Ambigolimax valentianus TaxID=1338344 RepID=A0A0E4FGU7_9EUPU|nr:histidine decarboxylase [Ambigolimax valentianus]
MTEASNKSTEENTFPAGGMTAEEYRQRAKDVVDYLVDYLQNIRERRVFPDVQPGYMQNLVPGEAPTRPDKWEDIFADVERVIMPGVTHWQSPYMHAYFPALNSYPSLLGDMLADAISCLGFTWASSPACTELETIVMDWLGKMLGMPSCFLHGDRNSKSMGGGCIQTTASDCTFVTLLAARTEAIRRAKAQQPDLEDAEINGRLIGYCSDQAHSSVEKAGLIGLVKMRFLLSDEGLSLRGDTLQEAITLDRERGFIPFYVCATLGTTGACAFDNLMEIGPVCEREHVWLHIDAAYAGTAFICPEYRSLMSGIDYADSFAFNPSKWMMVHFDCSAMWVKDARALHRTFNVEPLYLQHENSGAAIDYMHWQIALSRRFRSLKLWFVLRCFGVEGLQRHIRRGVDLAKRFELLVRADRRFEVTAKRVLGMIVFRIAGANELTENLLKRLNKQGLIHMVPASLKGKYVIRFTVTSQFTTEADIDRDWKLITDMAAVVLEDSLGEEDISVEENDEEDDENEKGAMLISKVADGDVVSTPLKHNSHLPSNGDVVARKRPAFVIPHAKGASTRRREFGISLLLSNVPMSPKVVNGSFAALFDDNNLDIDKLARQLIVGGEFIRLSPRKRGKLAFYDKQMSLDYSVLGDRKDNQYRMKMMGSLDSKIDDILEFGSKAQADNQRTKRKGGPYRGVDEEAEDGDSPDEAFKRNGDTSLDGGSEIPLGRFEKMGLQDEIILDQESWDTGHVDRKTVKVASGVNSVRSLMEIQSKFQDRDHTDFEGGGYWACEVKPETSGVVEEMFKGAGTSSQDGVKTSTNSSSQTSRSQRGSSRSVLEISKAVCSKMKDVFTMFPSNSSSVAHHTISPVPPVVPVTAQTSNVAQSGIPIALATTSQSISYCSLPGSPFEYCVRGYCKYCGSAVTADGTRSKTPTQVIKAKTDL